MHLPGKGASIPQLKTLLGEWKGQGEVFPNPWGPHGITDATWRFVGPGAHSLVHDYVEVRESGFKFSAHGVLTVDPETQDTLWFWFDNYGLPPLDPAHGSWDNGVLLLEKKTPRGANRTTFEIRGDELLYGIDVCLPTETRFQPVVRLQCLRVSCQAI